MGDRDAAGWPRWLIAVVAVIGLATLVGALLRSVAIGLVVAGAGSAVVVLVAVISRGARNPREPYKLSEGARQGWVLGLIFGASLGVVFSLALDNFAFLAIFPGAGMNIGLAIGAAHDHRRDEDQ